MEETYIGSSLFWVNSFSLEDLIHDMGHIGYLSNLLCKSCYMIDVIYHTMSNVKNDS